MENNTIGIKISAVYQSARSTSILRAKGQKVMGYELAVDGKDVAAIKSIAATIAAEAQSPDDVVDLAIKHGLIKEAK